MYKQFFILYLVLLSFSFAMEEFEYIGVEVNVTSSDNKVKSYLVKRHIPEACDLLLITNKMFWTGNFAHKNVPDVCKSTYIHTKGKLLAMSLDDDLETYGELEVLSFIKEMQGNPNLLLIDARTEQWYAYMTIPGAVKIPFIYFKHPREYEFEFEDALRFFGVKLSENKDYDFSDAKTILVFCNGPWCSQSPDMLFALMELGYPADKMKWYRGGIQDWLSAGMTTTRTQPKRIYKK